MPFDSLKIPTEIMLARLRALYDVAERATGRQDDWCQCLYHDAREDSTLVALGLPTEICSNGAPRHAAALANFIGISLAGPSPDSTSRGWDMTFGAGSLDRKRAYLRVRIAELERRVLEEAGRDFRQPAAPSEKGEPT